jgi:hypothetical protein
MSLLPNATYANPTTPFFGGAGPTPPPETPSDLQSPASILPDGGGDILLNMIATPGAANTSTALLVANGGTASILMNGGPNAGTGYEIAANNVASGSYLQIGGQTAVAPLIQLDNANHELTLGDDFAATSQVNLRSATIALDASLAGTVATAGVVTLNNINAGMKAANILLDASLVGTVNTGGVINLNNTGAGITTGANPGIVVNAAQTLIRGNYHYVVSLGTVANNVAYPITSPTQTGLYSITVGGAPGDATGIQSQVCCLAYYLGGSGFVSGGCSTALVQSGVNEYAQLITSAGSSGPIISFLYKAASPASITGLSARVVQLTGDLGF